MTIHRYSNRQLKVDAERQEAMSRPGMRPEEEAVQFIF